MENYLKGSEAKAWLQERSEQPDNLSATARLLSSPQKQQVHSVRRQRSPQKGQEAQEAPPDLPESEGLQLPHLSEEIKLLGDADIGDGEETEATEVPGGLESEGSHQEPQAPSAPQSSPPVTLMASGRNWPGHSATASLLTPGQPLRRSLDGTAFQLQSSAQMPPGPVLITGHISPPVTRRMSDVNGQVVQPQMPVQAQPPIVAVRVQVSPPMTRRSLEGHSAQRSVSAHVPLVSAASEMSPLVTRRSLDGSVQHSSLQAPPGPHAVAVQVSPPVTRRSLQAPVPSNLVMGQMSPPVTRRSLDGHPQPVPSNLVVGQMSPPVTRRSLDGHPQLTGRAVVTPRSWERTHGAHVVQRQGSAFMPPGQMAASGYMSPEVSLRTSCGSSVQVPRPATLPAQMSLHPTVAPLGQALAPRQLSPSVTQRNAVQRQSSAFVPPGLVQVSGYMTPQTNPRILSSHAAYRSGSASVPPGPGPMAVLGSSPGPASQRSFHDRLSSTRISSTTPLMLSRPCVPEPSPGLGMRRTLGSVREASPPFMAHAFRHILSPKPAWATQAVAATVLANPFPVAQAPLMSATSGETLGSRATVVRPDSCDLPEHLLNADSRTASQRTIVPEEELQLMEDSSKQNHPESFARKDSSSPKSGRSPEFTMEAFGQTLPNSKSQEHLPTARIESAEAAGERIRQRLEELQREGAQQASEMLPATPPTHERSPLARPRATIGTPASCRRELVFSPSASSRNVLDRAVAAQPQMQVTSLSSTGMPGGARVVQRGPAESRVAQPMQPVTRIVHASPAAMPASSRPQYWPSFLPKQTRVTHASMPKPAQH